MSREHSERQQKSHIKRERILQAAREMFPLSGYRGTSVAKIARQADVSTGLIYFFFDNKQGLYEALLKQELLTWFELTTHEAASPDDPLQEMRGMFTAVFDGLKDNPMLELVLSTPRSELEQYLPILQRINQRWRKRLVELLEYGIGSGEFRQDLDVERTADIIHSLQHTYLFRAFNNQTSSFPSKKLKLGKELDAQLVASVGDFITLAIKA